MIDELARLAIALVRADGIDRPLLVSAPLEAKVLVKAIQNIVPSARAFLHDPDSLYRGLLPSEEKAMLTKLKHQSLSVAKAMSEGAARITVLAPRPDLLHGVDSSRMAEVHNKIASIAVSYTHLTLPTNREV